MCNFCIFLTTKNFNNSYETISFRFFVSLISTLALIRYQHLFEKISSDHDLLGPQKFHAHAIPRVGGIGIYLALMITTLFAYFVLKLDRGLLLLEL